MSRDRYGADHRAIRRRLVPFAAGRRCVLCGEVMKEGDAVDLDHRPDGRGYRGLAHASCNRADGARRGNAMRGMKNRRTRMKTAAIGVAISVTRSHTSVAASGVVDGVNAFELVEYLPGSDTADQVAALVAERGLSQVVIDPRSPAATLIAALTDRKVKVVETSARDLAIAHGQFLDELRAGRLKLVARHPALDAAVQHAGVRPLAGADALERRRVEADASPFEAAELAVWGLMSAPKPINILDNVW